MRIEDWNPDSILSRAGYRADGSQSAIRRSACIDRAVAGRMENAMEVLQHLRWLVDDRGHRYPNACRRWKEDIEYVSRLINAGLPGNPSRVRWQVLQNRIQQEYRKQRLLDIFANIDY